VSPRATTQPKLGSAFKAKQEKPLGAAFTEAKEPLPQIIVMHPLKPFRDVLMKHGWPKKEPDINRAQAAAIAAGDLDLSAIEARYGKGAWEATPMIVYPPYAGEEDREEVIRVQQVGDVVKLIPGGR
jgi:hypothetical protein